MRFCSSAIFDSLTSTGAWTGNNVRATFEGADGLLPPVSHMMSTMSRAMPTSTQDCTCFGSKPGGFGAFSWSWAVSFMTDPSIRSHAAREGRFLFADGEIPAVDNLRG